MKNLLLSVLVLIGTIGSNKVLATVKIPEVNFMTRILADNFTISRSAKKSKSHNELVPNSLIPNSLLSQAQNLSSSQTKNKSDYSSYLLERINSIFLPKFTIATQEISAEETKQQKISVQAKKSLTKHHKISSYPTINRSSLIVNSPDYNSVANKLRLVNPVPETKGITSSFGWRIRPFSGQRQFHQGIDYGAPLGSPVVAAGNGIVTKVVSGCADFRNLSCGEQFGNRIEIDHGNGAIAIYAHLLNNSIKITEGTKVWQNQEIAQVGSSGWSSGAHLDFRLEIDGEFQDPAKYVK